MKRFTVLRAAWHGLRGVAQRLDDRLSYVSWGRPHRSRILALLAFRNEMRYLPGFFENVPPHVDGIIALDDGSTDGSGMFVARQPGVLELLRVPPDDPHIRNEPLNRRRLVQAAWRYRPDWLIGLDADERLERDFRRRALGEIVRATKKGYPAYSVVLRELWNAPNTCRVDGIWGRKRVARFFRSRLDHEFDTRQLHAHWAPLNSRHNGEFCEADLIIYHLRMMHEQDRRARHARYQAEDSDRRWQGIGYDYLIQEEGLQLQRLARGREYQPLGR